MASTYIFPSSNPDEWTSLEAVYIDEQPAPVFIRTVALNETGIAFISPRGPAQVVTVTSPEEALTIWGSTTTNNDIRKTLLGKKFGVIHGRRIVAVDAATATHDFLASATHIISVTATSPGAWGNSVTAAVEDATDAVSTHFNLRISDNGKVTLYENLDVNGTDNNLTAVIGDDITNPVVVTKLAAGRPTNAVAVALSGGSDGTAVDADFTAALDDLAAFKGPSIIYCETAAPSQTTLNQHIVTLATGVFDRVFLIWSGTHGNSRATEITAKTTQITTPNSRVCWCYNSAKVRDTTLNAQVDVSPAGFMASILSQNSADVHPGAMSTASLTTAIAQLRNEALSRNDLKLLLAAGIATLEKTDDGFIFHSVPATDGSEFVIRRERDFLQLSATRRLKVHVKEQNTLTRRTKMITELTTFSQQLMDDERYIEDFRVSEGGTTPTLRAQGVQILLWQVRLIGHIRFLVFRTNIDDGVVVDAAA